MYTHNTFFTLKRSNIFFTHLMLKSCLTMKMVKIMFWEIMYVKNFPLKRVSYRIGPTRISSSTRPPNLHTVTYRQHRFENDESLTMRNPTEKLSTVSPA